MYNQSKKRLGDLLVEAGLLTKERLETVLEQQKGSGKKLGEYLVDNDIIDEQNIIDVLEFQLRIPKIDFNKLSINPEIPKMISENLAKKYKLIPIQIEDGKLLVAMADPLDLVAQDDVRIASGMEIKPCISTKSSVLTAIERFYGKESAEKAVEDFSKQYIIDGQLTESDIELSSEVTNAPVVKLVNSIVQHAIKLKASDIHIEPLEDSFRIRFRIDGDLQEIMKSPKAAHNAVVTRIKIIGRMDIAEKRVPQDGRVEMNIDGKDVDLRLSVLPTVYGEKVVIRILGRSDIMMSRTELGLSPENGERFDKIIKSPNGIILVTGPTGSGKTTTLYAVLRELNKMSRNIITVEDPVEYRLEGINQVQVNTKAGLTFANGLRSILRQDPDIIMIGEIRDAETAEIAVRAAITGHLVLSTIHTNDSASTISRLVDMGIEPYLVSSSVVGIISQRLVRKICKSCKTSYKPEISELSLLKLREGRSLFKGTGCSACNNTGYSGRTAIHEVMSVGKEMRELIDRRANIDQIRHLASKTGTQTLRESCTQLVING
ncbi:MAG: Flp pilus assembly complex ATPase component TadA, partial [Clostridiales bacterium]|nr:Flp pilus assembly complex ATPase component TadA [Clostridiales bacterium]